ncbi:hypothetical protein GCM10010339_92790 [Streptomyces alanosinicus]|uniref:Uncharacterized protein n=1 Tax=Streptomyces alanosinicus TaxID=68171 RepID=A0A918YUU3_9ACTN|nr:hypothetical protein [Streptomyces alanosinicus]GHE16074.1 hypothetical protein GCM10010339_92790 [Streptomyces alanosinicus]
MKKNSAPIITNEVRAVSVVPTRKAVDRRSDRAGSGRLRVVPPLGVAPRTAPAPTTSAPTPIGMLSRNTDSQPLSSNQEPGDDRSGRGGGGHGHAPRPDGGAGPVSGENAPQQTQSRGLQQRAEQALDGAQADQKDDPVPAAVAQRTGWDQSDGEHQHITVRHPFQPGEAAMEFPGDGRVGDGHGGGVQGHHHRAQADRGQGPPPAVSARPAVSASAVRRAGG